MILSWIVSKRNDMVKISIVVGSSIFTLWSMFYIVQLHLYEHKASRDIMTTSTKIVECHFITGTLKFTLLGQDPKIIGSMRDGFNSYFMHFFTNNPKA